MTCTFFGHKDAPASITQQLETTIETLITNNSVTHFYVGNHGNFDRLVLHILIKMKYKHPHITYEIVLAYIPDKHSNQPTLYPEGIEKSPKKYAICFRNRWMIDHSDYVISHITHNFGGAYKFTSLAKKKGKTVINIL